MEGFRRIYWIVIAAGIPTSVMVGMLFFKIKSVEVNTANAEAELMLDRNSRFKRQMEEALGEPEGSPPPASQSQAVGSLATPQP